VFDQPPRSSLTKAPCTQLCEAAICLTSVRLKWSPCVVFQSLPPGLRSSTFFHVSRPKTFWLLVSTASARPSNPLTV
jgi:hypothetical protein